MEIILFHGLILLNQYLMTVVIQTFGITDKLCTLPLFKMSCIALDAFSARLTLFFLKDPVL
jgi:hypothetical protein